VDECFFCALGGPEGSVLILSDAFVVVAMVAVCGCGSGDVAVKVLHPMKDVCTVQ